MRGIDHRHAWGRVKSCCRDRIVRATRTRSGFALAPALESLHGRDAVDAGGRGPGVVTLVTDLSARHERLQLPPMSGRRRARALAHRVEASRDHGLGQETSVAPFRNAVPDDLLMVSVSRRVVSAAIEAARADGIAIETLTTPLAAIVGLLHATTAIDTDEGATVVVHLGESLGSVGFVHHGALLLSRAFQMPEGDDEEADTGASAGILDPTWHESVIAEIGRSLLYFNHELHGVPVGRMLVSSDLAGLEHLLPGCRERFRVPVSATIDVVGLDVRGFAEQLAPVGEAPAVWLGAIAAAITGLHGHPAINLLPHELLDARSRRQMVRGAVAAFLVVAGAISFLNVTTLADFRSAVSRLGEGRVRLSEMNELLHGLREERVERQAARERLALLSQAAAPVSAFGEVLTGLAVSAQSGVHLDRIRLAPDEGGEDPYASGVRANELYRGGGADAGDMEGGIAGAGRSGTGEVAVVVRGGRIAPRLLRVEGRVRAASVAEAERLFALFYGRLKKQHRLEPASFDPIEIRADEETGESVLSFVIQAPIEA